MGTGITGVIDNIGSFGEAAFGKSIFQEEVAVYLRANGASPNIGTPEPKA